MRLVISIFLIQYFAFTLSAITYTVGAGQSYVSPNALYLANVVNNGDTIYILAATYVGSASLANWSKNNLVIKGINGRPHMKANGQNLGGKAIWLTTGNNIHIENIEFSECTVPDQNGAGIRHENFDLTINHCYFHHNENGILTNNPNAGHVIIQYSEFAFNGFGDGYSHNLYIGHIAKLTFMHNYCHHANVGHNLKSRANENIILYNRIMDESTGNSSRLIDLPNGGLSIIMGNLLMKGPLAENNNLIGYGLEGFTNILKELYIINNSMVNKRTASCIYIQIQTGASLAQVTNNIFAGIGTLVSGTTTSMSNNYNTTNITDVQYVDEVNYDYHLQLTSPAVNGGLDLSPAAGYSLTPSLEYFHPTNHAERVPNAGLDIGAYEYNLPCTAAYASYTFDGNYNDQWYNAANWDNDCLPPISYNGVIQINANCITSGPSPFLLANTSQLIVSSGFTLFWIW